MTSLHAVLIWLLSFFGGGPDTCTTHVQTANAACHAPQAVSHAKAEEATTETWSLGDLFVLRLEDSTSDEPISNGF